MTTENDRIKLQARISHAGLLQSTPAAKRRSIQGEFLGEAPPHRALDALHSVLASPMSREELEQKHGRNTISVLIGLGIVNSLGVLCDSKVRPEDAESHMRNMAKAQPTILFVIDALASDPALKPERIGQLVAVEFGHPTWSVASAKRYGSALSIWARWASGEQVRRRLARPTPPRIVD